MKESEAKMKKKEENLPVQNVNFSKRAAQILNPPHQ